MINCIILDDEEHAIELLTLHVKQTPFLNLVGTATDPLEALQLLHSYEVELLFLDIQMPKMTGFEFMQLLDGKYKVILTTAFRDYAIEGFDRQVVDYLLKPIIFSRFFNAAQRAKELILAQEKDMEDFILVKTEYKGKLIKIKISDIIYIEGVKKYVRFHLREADPVTALLTIAGLEERLGGERFLRIHKSFIISLPHILMINGNMVHLEFASDHVPIGQTYRELFMGRMRGKVMTNNQNESGPG
ncbi:LytR/AlgR family response regulator transcription factor [Pedobacter mucosus]|uniref:LytR/AlgR family response regulator transcription factor n=1 Tax=Pedobacter mucosus TaxID=2895286 RepID=UPI001EE4E5FC|nr:LytTR family DNA-binding domain-containing protein [Pedobacter mucosus]UKT64991.1 LytTR family DNA-binding domain-containing protein [Pedobacter mucosus]